MKVSTNWLKEYIDFDYPLEELADKLTMAGLEVEEIDELSKLEIAAEGGSGSTGDTVFDVTITPNRGDWLSMIGVAREVSSLVGNAVKVPEPEVVEDEVQASDLVSIRIDDPDLCARYVGVVVRGVQIKESPGWLRDKLIASGMRPINNVVDITNYVLMEYGQPLHAFDLDLLHGRQIIVRRAAKGETMVSLDGVERKLEPDMLVIADADRAVALAGVMGGADSEVTGQTQDILIESANFNAVSIRRTSKRLGLATEASFRFERGVDIGISVKAAVRAAQLMQELAGGKVAGGVVDVCTVPIKPLDVTVRPQRVNAILGANIETQEMTRLLGGLGIETRVEDGVLSCSVPTFRQDVTREIDLIEEIGRAYGYDKLQTTLPGAPLQGKDSPECAFAAKVRRILMSCGAQEVLTHSMVDDSLAELAGLGDQCIRIRNPLSEELDGMRVMLMPNMAEVVARNQAHGLGDVSVFEIGNVYRCGTDAEIDEHAAVCFGMVGKTWDGGWNLPTGDLVCDFYACKGVVERLLEALGIDRAVYSEGGGPLLHPTRRACVSANGNELGVVGELTPAAAEALGTKGRPCFFELDMNALMAVAPSTITYEDVPHLPALYRHLGVVVEDGVSYETVEKTVAESGGGLVERVDLLDVYRGEQIGDNRHNLTLSIVFRTSDRTLTDQEVNSVLEEIRAALVREVEASFR